MSRASGLVPKQCIAVIRAAPPSSLISSFVSRRWHRGTSHGPRPLAVTITPWRRLVRRVATPHLTSWLHRTSASCRLLLPLRSARQAEAGEPRSVRCAYATRCSCRRRRGLASNSRHRERSAPLLFPAHLEFHSAALASSPFPRNEAACIDASSFFHLVAFCIGGAIIAGRRHEVCRRQAASFRSNASRSSAPLLLHRSFRVLYRGADIVVLRTERGRLLSQSLRGAVLSGTWPHRI